MKTRTNPGLQLHQAPVAADVSPRHCPEFAPAPASGCEVLKAALLCLTLAWAFTGAAQTEKPSAAIPFAEIGAKATADYQGDALDISATADGVRLRCGFQKLEGRATPEGLWLESTAPGDGGRLRLVAESVGRDLALVEASPFLWAGFDHLPTPSLEPGRSGASVERRHSPENQFAALFRDAATGRLADSGTVEVADKLVRFIRPGVTEEYSVSVDGVRQDFVITERPIGDGDLRVELALAGARAEAMAYGANLKLEGSGRTLAYSRLRATDATGKELTARMEVSPVAAEVTRLKTDGEAGNPSAAPKPGEGGKAETSQSLLTSAATEARLAVVVDDADAVYPVRIDPTFSDEDWISMGGRFGADGPVWAAAVDGSGNLYIGGHFTILGNAFATNVAKWNGSSWSALGAGVRDGRDGTYPCVYALAVSGGDLFVGGWFTMAGGYAATNVAKWDGSSWSPLGSGVDNTVHAVAVLGTNLYAGGEFAVAGGSAANRIAKWNGTSWSALGQGVNDRVSALAVMGTNLYVGGYFTAAGGSATDHVAKWNGSSWSALGSGVGGSVCALAVSGNSLCVGGWFTTAGGIAATNVAKWNGSSWSALGSGVNSTVYALVVSGNDLYVGGHFTKAGGTVATNVAKWNGSSWSALGLGVDSTVHALAVLGRDLYAGGVFIRAGGLAATNVAKWDGSSWSALGSGLDGGVSALVVSGSDLYVAGAFATACGCPANRVAKWDGNSWSALGSGIGGPSGYPYYGGSVSALAVSGSDLYVGGKFTTAGGSLANRVAKWDGNSWSALGSGISAPSGSPYYDGSVSALAVSGSDLYVGGYFTTAGSSPANRVAKWDGSSWSALGSGITDPSGVKYGGSVSALAVLGSDLYAGGDFDTAGGRSMVYYLAKWNGSNWAKVGSGVSGGPVYALAVSGTDLYVGGNFWAAGGIEAAGRVAKWNGSSWSAFGWGVGESTGACVYTLAVSGNDLYVGGKFTTAGGRAANYVAKWNGNSWSALGSGLNSTVKALAMSGSDLYVGGDFITAGGKVSPYLARASLIPQRGVIQNIGVHGGVIALDCLGLPGTAFTVQRATDVLFTADLTTLLTTNAPTPDGQFRCTDSNPPSTTAFYRLLKQ